MGAVPLRYAEKGSAEAVAAAEAFAAAALPPCAIGSAVRPREQASATSFSSRRLEVAMSRTCRGRVGGGGRGVPALRGGACTAAPCWTSTLTRSFGTGRRRTCEGRRGSRRGWGAREGWEQGWRAGGEGGVGGGGGEFRAWWWVGRGGGVPCMLLRREGVAVNLAVPALAMRLWHGAAVRSAAVRAATRLFQCSRARALPPRAAR